MLCKRKAQATTEFVVLGALIIIAFSFLMQYSEKLNRQQSYLQQTFRAALKEARSANNSAAYTKVAFRRMANVASPMELGQLQSFSNSANVLWADGKSTAEHGVSKYQLNEAAAVDIPVREYPDGVNADGTPKTTTTPPAGTVEISKNSFINITDATTTSRKQENAGVIVTNKILDASDTLQADVNVGGTPMYMEHTLGDGGKYYPGTNKLIRQRSMQ